MAKWGGPRVTRLRARMAKDLPVICWRCGQWITQDMAWTIGHVIEVDLAPELMWDPENHRLEHADCNFRAGAVYGNRKRGRATQVSPTSRAWVRGVSA